MQKAKIALCGGLEQDGSKQFVNTNYIDACKKVGLLPWVFPYQIEESDIAAYLDGLNGILVCGGVDVDPKYYGEKAHEKLGDVNHWRDTLELMVIRHAMERKMPILGICRGFQILNIYFGGTLYQDIPSQYPSTMKHSFEKTEEAYHDCRVVENTPAATWFAGDTTIINTFHHQGVKDLAADFSPSVYAPDGLIEAFYSEKYSNIIAVQWHPERACTLVSQRIFADFAALCNQYKRK